MLRCNSNRASLPFVNQALSRIQQSDFLAVPFLQLKEELCNTPAQLSDAKEENHELDAIDVACEEKVFERSLFTLNSSCRR